MSNWLSELNKRLSESDSPIALWTAGGATKDFLAKVSPELDKKIILIVDSDPSKEGTPLAGRTINHPSKADFSRIGTIVITSKVFHAEIKDQIAQIEQFNGTVIDLFEEKIRSLNFSQWSDSVNQFMKENGLSPIMFTGDDTLLVTGSGIRLCFSKIDQNNQLVYDMLEGDAYEPDETEFLISSVGEGGCLVDIGANIGWFSLSAADRLRDVEVHAFEPAPETFSLLSKNVDHNGLKDKIRLNQMAVGDKEGKVHFTTGFDNGNHIKAESGKGTIEVAMTTLDEYVEKNSIKKIDFIKCDIEGAELLMLLGAEKAIERFKPKIMLELEETWLERFGHSTEQALEFFSRHGYSPYSLGSDQKLRPFTPSADQSRNLVFVHKEDMIA